MFETPNSAVPSGTTAGIQFAAVFQSLLIGFALQVALLAKRVGGLANKKAPPQSRVRRNRPKGVMGLFIGLIPLFGVLGTAVMLSQPSFFYLACPEKGKLNRVPSGLLSQLQGFE